MLKSYKKKCWWTHEFTRHFFSKLKRSVFFLLNFMNFTVLSLLAKNSNLLFLHLRCVAVRLFLMCVLLLVPVHTF